MTTGPADGKCANPAGGPGGMPLALRLNEGIDPARGLYLLIITFALLALSVEVVNAAALGLDYKIQLPAFSRGLIQPSKPGAVAMAEGNIIDVAKYPESLVGVIFDAGAVAEILVKSEILTGNQEALVPGAFATR